MKVRVSCLLAWKRSVASRLSTKRSLGLIWLSIKNWLRQRLNPTLLPFEFVILDPMESPAHPLALHPCLLQLLPYYVLRVPRVQSCNWPEESWDLLHLYLLQVLLVLLKSNKNCHQLSNQFNFNFCLFAVIFQSSSSSWSTKCFSSFSIAKIASSKSSSLSSVSFSWQTSLTKPNFKSTQKRINCVLRLIFWQLTKCQNDTNNNCWLTSMKTNHKSVDK